MATIEQEALVTLTEGAASKIRGLIAEEPEGEAGVLRIAVQGGGCSGFEYALGFDSGAQEGDHQLDAYGIQIAVDPLSAPYLQVTSACGCGHSFPGGRRLSARRALSRGRLRLGCSA